MTEQSPGATTIRGIMAQRAWVMQNTRCNLVVVLALASAGVSSFSCGGSEFVGNENSGGGGQSAMGGASSTGSAGKASGGEGGGGGTARIDAAADGHGGGSGSGDDGGRADAPAKDVGTDISTSDAPTVLGTCTLGGTECPSGYECGCGAPGPGICECHKKCQSAADCSAPNAMCGCSANDSVKICVSMCFCFCG